MPNAEEGATNKHLMSHKNASDLVCTCPVSSYFTEMQGKHLPRFGSVGKCDSLRSGVVLIIYFDDLFDRSSRLGCATLYLAACVLNLCGPGLADSFFQ
jgi:hypothetical protein